MITKRVPVFDGTGHKTGETDMTFTSEAEYQQYLTSWAGRGKTNEQLRRAEDGHESLRRSDFDPDPLRK